MRFLSMMSVVFVFATSRLALAAPTAHTSTRASAPRHGRRFLDYVEALKDVQSNGLDAEYTSLHAVARKAKSKADPDAIAAIRGAMPIKGVMPDGEVRPSHDYRMKSVLRAKVAHDLKPAKDAVTGAFGKVASRLGKTKATGKPVRGFGLKTLKSSSAPLPHDGVGVDGSSAARRTDDRAPASPFTYSPFPKDAAGQGLIRPTGSGVSKLNMALSVGGGVVFALAGIDLIYSIVKKGKPITNDDIQTLITYAIQNPSQFGGMYQTLVTEGATSAQLNTFTQGVEAAVPSVQVPSIASVAASPSGSKSSSGSGSSTTTTTQDSSPTYVQGLPNTWSNSNAKRTLRELD